MSSIPDRLGASRLRVRTVEILPDAVVLIDQLALPHEEKYVRCVSWRDVAGRIADMTVRGAPAIGVSAAAGGASRASRQGSRTCRPRITHCRASASASRAKNSGTPSRTNMPRPTSPITGSQQ